MRILKLEFENINSLKGQHVIDFTEKPLADSDIFAIIGPMGSGKSTILDVITLALFNKTPRFNKISKNSLTEQGSIITRNQNRASAKITYEAKGKIYLSSWAIAKNNRGNWNDYHMEIWSDGKAFDLKKSEVPPRNERIIGLDYEQFTKAIILSQGEFAKFLKADLNERSILLEKITGTSIYRELGRKAHEVEKEKKSEVVNMESALNAIKTFSFEEIETFETQKTELQEILTKDRKILEGIDKLLNKKKESIRVQGQLQDWNEKKVTNDSNIKDFQPEIKKLELHHKVFPYRKDLDDYRQTKADILNNKNNIEAYKAEYKVYNDKKNTVIDTLSTITKKKVTDENFVTINNDFENAVKALIERTNQIKIEGETIRDDIDQLINTNELRGFNLNVKTMSVHSIETRIQEIKASLDKYLVSTIAEIEADKKEIESSIFDYNLLVQYQKTKSSYEHDMHESEKKMNTIIDVLYKLPTTLKDKEKDQHIVKIELENLHLKLERANFEEHRQELVDGEECPLCGATSHPFASQDMEDKETLNQQIKIKQKALQSVDAEIKKIDREITTNKTNLKSTEERISQSKDKLNTLQEDTLSQLINKTLIDRDDFESNLQKAQSALTEINGILSNKRKIEPLERLKIKVGKRTELGEAYLAVKNEKDTLYSGNDIVKEMNDLQTTFTESLSDSVLIKSKQEKEEELLEKHIEELEVLKKNIRKIIKVTGIESYDALQASMMTEDVVNVMEQRKRQLEEKKTEIDTRIKALQEQATALQTEEVKNADMEVLEGQQLDLKTKISINTQNLGGLTEKLDNNAAENKRKEHVINELDRLRKEHLRWEKLSGLIGDSKGKKFSTFAQTLTLQQLIAFTNKRLESLSGRYLLFADSKNQDLMIIDTHQGNTERSVKTLSGGETFLVSLALALSLSDMAARNVKLDSLFIDEGFGTLDENTLENAMGLLEKLQSENDKTVGIISHVKQLKERIAVQIQLDKNSQGHSTIKIVER